MFHSFTIGTLLTSFVKSLHLLKTLFKSQNISNLSRESKLGRLSLPGMEIFSNHEASFSFFSVQTQTTLCPFHYKGIRTARDHQEEASLMLVMGLLLLMLLKMKCNTIFKWLIIKYTNSLEEFPGCQNSCLTT